ncbi:TM0106 family RecB-like putative nuclease [Paenarthrobacter sp. DKR-5]|uniref:TM0106 family RecB-like putative nuclease n=1 Tax=Paenarthrobacter sp. DKR-5 TaxID=2835535 RepID=UPI001BDCCC75|nr:bifunctional RecB family nuclease/DEAD/DEAH box helicase [Paenarthrobacter sp. DKR-5]MBT1004095.1 TM0106 family RecB-like putative nuclease [Paenarthrobacter sp. DKR-5]
MFLLTSETPGAHPDLVFSASDLVAAAVCEYAVLRTLDDKLGRGEKLPAVEDKMLERTARLGDAHELRVLEGFVAEYGRWDPAAGRGVYEIEPAAAMTRAALSAKHGQTLTALRAGADVVFQGSFFDGSFHGRSDFLVKTADDGGARYAVYDTKLARHAKVTALLQLAAYGDQLQQAGIPTAPTVHLILGDGSSTTHRLADILPVYRERRQRLLTILDAHRRQPLAVEWGDPRYTACGRCDVCKEQVQKTRDLLMVAGMSLSRRKKLITQGVPTIEALASLELPQPSAGSLVRLREQARMQTGTGPADGSAGGVAFSFLAENTLATLPPSSPGDIFFDFEGDPLWTESGSADWGLEYLFGVMEAPASPGHAPEFRAFWAHNRAEERQALLDFLAYVAERRSRYPDMHIYHYANYEKAALRRLSLRHGTGEDAVDGLLRDGVLVDLYNVVRHSVRISAHSYSIKSLEPLYMGPHLRTGDVKDAGASVVAYALYCEARDAERTEEAAEVLASIEDYNTYDCLSTLKLRDWLVRHARERDILPHEVTPAAAETGTPVPETAPDEPGPAEAVLLERVSHAREEAAAAHRPLGADDEALALLAAATGHHRREEKQFWWAHFDRLSADVGEWQDTRDVFVADSARVVENWSVPTGKKSLARTVRLAGSWADGSEVKPGLQVFSMYDAQLPAEPPRPNDGRTRRDGFFGADILEVGVEDGKDVVVLRERLPKGCEPFAATPMALTPNSPIPTNAQRESIAALARSVGDGLPALPDNPALDILRRRAPRLRSLDALPVAEDGAYIPSITAAVADLDSSYLAVQGPPGSGKTHVGSHVIADLVGRGWKVGVVAQSHAVIENMFSALTGKAGVPAHRVGKKPSNGSTPADVPWTWLKNDAALRAFLDEGAGVVGGTAWDFANAKRFGDAELDLLVIDEAGQYSLANTVAVSRAAKRLLLLGDPQQLPQVTQGTHPEPVDTSALGWLSQGHNTLPADLGYFLATTWRMHPVLAAAVSHLSYDDRLSADPCTAERRLSGVAPGVHCLWVEHRGNATSSPEEARAVVREVQKLIELPWTPGPDAGPRPLEQGDILVVAAYNAQVQLIRRALADAGWDKVPVGTVDKFQGQEAPVVIVSLAASAPGEVPRGMEFLISRNRVNVAVSRAQWCAVVVRSPELTAYLPTRPEGLEELGAFIGLCASGSSETAPRSSPVLTDPEFERRHRAEREHLRAGRH